jgi:MFS family permease
MQVEETKTNQLSQEPKGRMFDLLRLRNFRLLWIGEAISLIGDQFYLIALPWLVLQLTGDALAMGTVLALAAIPRALFMVVGGALTDRFSPRAVMLVSNLTRMGLVALLAGLVLSGAVQLWMLYILALAFGLMDAFFYPAQSAIIPRLVSKEQLQAANAVIQGTAQLSLFLGPVLAGALIALLSDQTKGASPDLTGIGLAFALDALTFLASAATLWLLTDGRKEVEGGESPAGDDSLLKSIGQGLRVVVQDPALRAFFLLIALSNLLVNGPFFVGVPVLAATRFTEGAAAFGIIMSAFGGGSLLGTVLAGVLPRPRPQTMGIVLGIIWSGLGLGVLALGLVNSTPAAAAIALAMGMAEGYVVILFITWLQRRTEEAMLGRMMSLLMLASVGLQPISSFLTGALIGFNAQALFMAAGGLMVLLVFFFMLNPAVRAMEETPAGAPTRTAASQSPI